jgi:hypothetical protein
MSPVSSSMATMSVKVPPVSIAILRPISNIHYTDIISGYCILDANAVRPQAFRWRMIFSEKRYPLFRIML